MKNLKRIFAVVMVVAIFSTVLCGCEFHQKNETVLTVGETKVGSELYLMYLFQSFNEFKSKLDEKITSENGTALENTADYFKQSLDGKNADEWITDKCKDYLRTFAWTEKNFKDLGLTISDEQNVTIGQYKEYIMYYNSSIFEKNGISEEAVKLFCSQSVKEQSIFEYYYGKEGKKAVSENDVFNSIKETYIEANILTFSLVDDEGNAVSDDQKAQYDAIAQDYVKRLNAGEMTFAEAEKQINPQSADETAEQPEETEKEEDDTVKSAFEGSAVYTADDSDTTLYDEFKKAKDAEGFEYDKVQYVTLTDKIVVYAIRDVEKDKEYMLDRYDMSARHKLKDDEFEKTVSEEKAAMSYSEEKSLIKRYKASKLDLAA